MASPIKAMSDAVDAAPGRPWREVMVTTAVTAWADVRIAIWYLQRDRRTSVGAARSVADARRYCRNSTAPVRYTCFERA